MFCLLFSISISCLIFKFSPIFQIVLYLKVVKRLHRLHAVYSKNFLKLCAAGNATYKFLQANLFY